jgi:hypothetical protein
VQNAVRRQLYAVLLFQTVVLMAAALDVIARSDATPAHAAATPSRKTLAPMIGVRPTASADARERPTPPVPLGPGHAHPPSRVLVDVVFDESISPKLWSTAMKEVTGIWSAYGVDVQAPGAGESGRSGAIRLTVTIGEHPDPQGVTGTLGSIGFVDDVPEPAIVMYPTTIADLVSSAQFGGFDLHTPSAFRDFLRARVFGRALAHEIGHFLLRSRRHSDAGLMRAMHRANDLVAANRHRFELTTNEVTRLVSLTSFRQSSSAMNRP